MSALPSVPIASKHHVITSADARDLRETCDLWITDPPYADAVNYHELGDFFLAWYEKQLAKAFPEWPCDARAELAVRGDGEDFRRSMMEIYRNLAHHMPDNGLQMVMFTHQNPAVWADLGMILWAGEHYPFVTAIEPVLVVGAKKRWTKQQCTCIV
jgi:adenine-specific DNA methylase